MQVVNSARIWLLVAVFGSICAWQAQAQSFPDKPVHIIVGVSAGGGTDFTARVLAQQLSKLWGQPVIVENRPGAAGSVADEFVAKAPPDGYTLLFTSDDITAISAVRPKLPYDLLRDFTPVSLVATAPDVIAVTPSLPVHDVKELIALARSEPSKVTYGTPGVGSGLHLQTARFAAAAKIDLVHVPYKGSGAAVVGVAAGEVDLALAPLASVRSLVKAGKIRLIAISTAQRSPLFPSIQTIGESGLAGFAFANWYGLLAPAGLPAPVLAALNAGVGKAVNVPEMKASLVKQSAEPQVDSSAQFADFIRNGLTERIKIVKSAGIKAQ